MVPFVEVLWGHSLTPGDLQARSSFTRPPFPKFPVNETLEVVEVNLDLDESTRLTLLSLQGLVNRERVRVYLDFNGEAADSGSILNFISVTHGIPYETVSAEELIERYMPLADGLFVYDPSTPESVNIGTIHAAAFDWIIVGPQTARELSLSSGVRIALDYASSDWAGLSDQEAYERALVELYPQLSPNFLAILPPDRWAIRDYLIAAKVFVFYYTQGALASPGELEATYRILHSTPRGIPMLGWFNSQTETEENLFIQMLSHEGKYMVGGYNVTNLSVLTSLGRDKNFSQSDQDEATPPLEDKIYAVVAVADGDNLDYIGQRMLEFWDGPIRGTMPIAWSLNPILVDLAPPFIEYYYGSATPLDRFVASPSGAGYLYPDFLRPGDLEPFLNMTRGYLERCDMDVVWLLNSFPAHEVRYSAASLSAYASHLKPRGLVLDYADAPVTRSAWMEWGDGSPTPVVRGTHLWTTKANLLGKVQAAMDAWEPGPQFLWITIYPWRFNLEDGLDVVSELKRRSQGSLEVVSVESYLNLLQQHFLRRAGLRLEEVRADPWTGSIMRTQIEEAGSRISLAETLFKSGKVSEGAYEAFAAGALLDTARLWAQILILTFLVGGLSAVSLFVWRDARRGKLKNVRMGTGPPWFSAISLGAVVTLYVTALRSTLDANFWTYHFLLTGLLAGGGAIWLKPLLARLPPRPAYSIASLGLIGASVTSLFSAAAFALTMFFTVLVMSFVLRRPGQAAGLALLATAIGVVAAFSLPIGLWLPVAAGGVLMAAIYFLKEDRSQSLPIKGGWLPGAALALVILGLAPLHYNSLRLRLNLEGEALLILSMAILALAVLSTLSLALWVPRVRLLWTLIGGVIVTSSSIGLLIQTPPLIAVLLMFLIVLGLTVFAHGEVHSHLMKGGTLDQLVRPFLAAIVLLLLFMGLPPLTYSLLFTPLPEVAEYALYTPQIFLVIIGLSVLAAASHPYLTRLREGSTEKTI